jgi:hypothetical protein
MEVNLQKYVYLQCERETLIRYADDEQMAHVESFNLKYAQKLLDWVEKYPDEVKLVRNKYSGVAVLLPKKWVKIKPPRKLTDEQRESLRAASLPFKFKGSKHVD